MSERFNSIFSPHIGLLYATAYHWTQNQAEAEDLVQDLAIKLLPQVRKLEALDQPLSWMKKSLYHLFIDRYRRSQFSVVMPVDDVAALMESHDDEQQDELIESHELTQLRQALLEALDTLDGPQRVAISLFEMGGYSLKDIADLQEVSIGTVKSRLFRAKEKLKKCIELEPFLDISRVNE